MKSSSHVGKMRSPSFILLLPCVLLISAFFFHLQLNHIAPLAVSRWGSAGTHLLLRNTRPKDCYFVAMIISSEEEVRNGTIDAWYRTLPNAQRNFVCCVAVRRSPSMSFHFTANRSSCDTLFVPMVRDDEYLTISEKVILGFQKITSFYNFKWLLKTDADSFVCFSRLLQLMSNYDPDGVTQLGYAESRNILIEDPGHKWYDPSMTDIVHNSRQPVVSGTGLYHPYMQGAGYVLSRGAFDRFQTMLPNLRYSPMEDAMVGSWFLALNAHRAVLDLDLRANRKLCYLPDYLYISHYRKGKEALELCQKRNEGCADLSNLTRAPVNDVAFLISARMDERKSQNLDVYDSIRAIFPTNEILFGDSSMSEDFLQRVLTSKSDANLKGFSFPNMSMHLIWNELLGKTQVRYVCILQDVQRLSWETMLARMVLPVHRNEVDIASGFLTFNPHMSNSSLGLYENGYTLHQKDGLVTRHKFPVDHVFPNESISVHGTSGFIVSRRDFLLENRWRDYGSFTEDEFHLRLYRKRARIKLVNSGVRHGYHYPLEHVRESREALKKYVPRMCRVLSEMPEKVLRLSGSNVTLDCDRRMFKRDYTNPNFTSLSVYHRW